MLRQNFEELKTATDEASQELSVGVENTWMELKGAFDVFRNAADKALSDLQR